MPKRSGQKNTDEFTAYLLQQADEIDGQGLDHLDDLAEIRRLAFECAAEVRHLGLRPDIGPEDLDANLPPMLRAKMLRLGALGAMRIERLAQALGADAGTMQALAAKQKQGRRKRG